MGKTIFKIALLLIAMALIALGVSLLFPGTPPPAPRPLPNPNGYDIFISAGKLLPKMTGDPNRLPREQLAPFIAANSNALQLARTGFAMEARVPVRFTAEYLTNHVRDVVPVRGLAQVLAAEGRLAEFDGHTNRAAEIYLDTVQLGYSISAGGIVIDAMIGSATAGLGITRLKSLTAQLDAATSRAAASRLESAEARSEEWHQIMAREQEYMRYYDSGIRARLYSIISSRMRTSPLAKAETRFNEQKTQVRKLMIVFAARAYELEKGTKPKTAADLVPDYLKSIPIDPVSKSNLTLEP